MNFNELNKAIAQVLNATDPGSVTNGMIGSILECLRNSLADFNHQGSFLSHCHFDDFSTENINYLASPEDVGIYFLAGELNGSIRDMMAILIVLQAGGGYVQQILIGQFYVDNNDRTKVEVDLVEPKIATRYTSRATAADDDWDYYDLMMPLIAIDDLSTRVANLEATVATLKNQ